MGSDQALKRLAFYFDSSSCSGCKACQAACKDKNGLGAGILWRRVYEISGGGWKKRGSAWESTVFAYNVSLGCNHCDKPICREICPAGAYRVRSDGIVLLDSQKCMGCKYCSWACPYGAPQYDANQGCMSKCNFCFDDLDQNRPPACVAACALRALDFGDRHELEARYGKDKLVYPLPEKELTGPALLLTPHKQATVDTAAAGERIDNLEEVGKR